MSPSQQSSSCALSAPVIFPAASIAERTVRLRASSAFRRSSRVADRSHLHFVEPAGRLLTVAGDERDRRPSLQQGHGPLDPGTRAANTTGQSPGSFVRRYRSSFRYEYRKDKGIKYFGKAEHESCPSRSTRREQTTDRRDQAVKPPIPATAAARRNGGRKRQKGMISKIPDNPFPPRIGQNIRSCLRATDPIRRGSAYAAGSGAVVDARLCSANDRTNISYPAGARLIMSNRFGFPRKKLTFGDASPISAGLPPRTARTDKNQ